MITALLLAGCLTSKSPTTPPAETGQPADTAQPADTGEHDWTFGGSGREVAGTLTFVDGWYGAPVAGLDVALAEAETTTDAAGSAAVVAPADTVVDLVLTGKDRPVTHLYAETGDADFYGTIPVPTSAALDALAASFGVTRDPARATLSFTFVDALSELNPVWAPGYHPVVPAAFEVALVADAAGTYTVGDSSLEGAPATFLYFNVAPGEVELTTTAACARWAFPSGGSAARPVLAAGELTLVHYTTDCD